MPLKKNIYFAKKNPHLVEAWRPRWRRHAALAMTLPLWKTVCKYSQCDPIVSLSHLPASAHGYNGIGVVWMRGEPGFTDTGPADGVEILIQDEQEVFAGIVGDFSLITQETVLREDHESPVKIFVLAPSIMKNAEARLFDYGDTLLNNSHISAYVKRLAVNIAIADDFTTNSCIDYAGVIELSTADLTDAEKLLASPCMKTGAYDCLTEHDVGPEIIITNENIFYDEQTGCNDSQRLIEAFLGEKPSVALRS
jgi:hypothetical protein